MAGRRDLNPSQPVAYVIDEFLDWVTRERSEATFDFYQGFLISFVEYVGYRLTVADLKPLHVTRWASAEYGSAAETTRNSAIGAVQRVLNWAVKQGIIDRSPIAVMEKPPRNRREVFVTQELFDAMFALVKDQPFRDFLTVLWETGCRPQEVRAVEAHNFIEERGVWLFERVKSKGKRKRRLVILTPTAIEITRRLAKANPKGPIFRNNKGNPWTKDAINCRFVRLRKQLRKKGVEFQAFAYAFRHGFGTAKIREGADSFSVAKLMGHSDTKMLEWVYAHVDQDDQYLRGVLTGEDA
jgi:integrase